MGIGKNMATLSGKVAEKVGKIYDSYKEAKFRKMNKELADLQEKKLIFEGKLFPINAKIEALEMRINKMRENFEN